MYDGDAHGPTDEATKSTILHTNSVKHEYGMTKMGHAWAVGVLPHPTVWLEQAQHSCDLEGEHKFPNQSNSPRDGAEGCIKRTRSSTPGSTTRISSLSYPLSFCRSFPPTLSFTMTVIPRILAVFAIVASATATSSKSNSGSSSSCSSNEFWFSFKSCCLAAGTTYSKGSAPYVFYPLCDFC